MALALYRKYRPATFAEVVGQEHVTEPLSRALEAGRINHAYLFSGPRGCGKTSSARILARSLNCELGPTPEPCGVCPSCVSLAPGGPGNIDVTELDAASHGGVDDTRELRDRAFFAPAESRYRVFIVDEAHMITTQGFNALLKIVEEPPEHLVFVFATTEPEKVLPTIRSRTHHYPFRLIPPSTLRSLLEGICADEGVTVAPAVYPLVIRAGGGSARDSLSVLDQLLSGAGSAGVTYERAVALLGVSDVALIDDVVDGLAAGDRAAVFEAVDRLVEAGHDPRRFAADLLQRLRDLTLLQAVPEAVGQGLVEAAEDEIARMADQAARFGEATLTRYGEILHAGLVEMRGATAPRLLLELLCARMLLPAATPSEAGLLERIERLERRNAIAPGPDTEATAGRTFERPSTRASDGASEPGEAGTAARGAGSAAAPGRAGPRRAEAGGAAGGPGGNAAGGAAGTGSDEAGRAGEPGRTADRGGSVAAESVDAVRAAEAGASGDGSAGSGPGSGRGGPAGADAGEPPPGSVAAGAAPVDAAAVRRVWPEILAQAKERRKRTGALLVSATVRAVEGDTLVLAIGTAPLARMLSEQSNLEVLVDSLHAVLGVRWRVRCEHGEVAATRSRPPEGGAPPSGAGGGGAGRAGGGQRPQAGGPGGRDRSGSRPEAAAAAGGTGATGAATPTAAGPGAGGSGARDVAGARSVGRAPDAVRQGSGGRDVVGPGPEGHSGEPGGGGRDGSHGGGAGAGRRNAAGGGRSYPTRPGGRAEGSPGRGRREDGVPLPPEPPDEDVPPEDEEEMLAEAALPPERRSAVPVPTGPSPETAALELLTSQLGARAIDPR